MAHEHNKNMSQTESHKNEDQTTSSPQSQSPSSSHYDSGYAWVVCAAIFVAHGLTLGFSYTIGVYYVVFRDVFGHSAGVTAWVSSLNFGTATFIGKYQDILSTVCTYLAFEGMQI